MGRKTSRPRRGGSTVAWAYCQPAAARSASAKPDPQVLVGSGDTDDRSVPQSLRCYEPHDFLGGVRRRDDAVRKAAAALR